MKLSGTYLYNILYLHLLKQIYLGYLNIYTNSLLEMYVYIPRIC